MALRSRDLRLVLFPTQRLAAAVACAGLLWFLPGAGAVAAPIALALIVMVAIVDYLRIPTRRDLVLERIVPSPMGLGDACEISYVVRSTAARSAWLRLYDAIPDGITATVPGDRFILAPQHEVRIDVPAVGEQRGRYDIGPGALRVETTLGLVARIIRIKNTNETAVVPSLANVRALRLLALQNRLSDVGVRALKQRGEGSAFAGLRDYVPGDDPRLVDWKATARHARLITREQSVERSQTVITMIDCGRAMTQLAGRYARFEHVLSSALLLADVASASDDRVGLLAFDDAIRAFVAPQKGLAALRGLRTTLSTLDATVTEPDYAAAFRLLAMRQRRRALVVFFTDVVDARAAQTFLAHANRASRRHLLLVVAIQNEELVASARPSTAGAAALYRSAAAEELVREREEALARMRRAGIAVLDIPAGRMAASVVNRYLEIKSRGLL